MDPLTPAEGWGVLHLFFDVGPGLRGPNADTGLRGPNAVIGNATDTEAVVSAVKAAEADDHQVVTFALLGHKAQLGVMALGPDLWRLQRLQADLIAAGLRLVNSYVSLTEVSEYAKGMPPERLEPRLHPQLPPPDARVLCFYPMSKRRGTTGNWYALPYEERYRLMEGHGRVGRTFRGQVVQLVTGSTGLDDWEWGVTLFAQEPGALKACVHEMRFDEASAIYADFGPFYVGLLGSVEEVLNRVGAG